MACARSFYLYSIRTHSRAVDAIRESGLIDDRVTARARKTARTAPLKWFHTRCARLFVFMCGKLAPCFPPPWFPPHPLPRLPPCIKVILMRGQPIRPGASTPCARPRGAARRKEVSLRPSGALRLQPTHTTRARQARRWRASYHAVFLRKTASTAFMRVAAQCVRAWRGRPGSLAATRFPPPPIPSAPLGAPHSVAPSNGASPPPRAS